MPNFAENTPHPLEDLPSPPKGWRTQIHTAYPVMTDISALLEAINKQPARFYEVGCDLPAMQKTGLLLEQYFHHAALLYDQAQDDPDQQLNEQQRPGILSVATMKGDAAQLLREEIQAYVSQLDVRAVIRKFGSRDQEQLDKDLPDTDYYNERARVSHWFERAVTLSEQVNAYDHTRELAEHALPPVPNKARD